jgi:hypothetical protein
MMLKQLFLYTLKGLWFIRVTNLDKVLIDCLNWILTKLSQSEHVSFAKLSIINQASLIALEKMTVKAKNDEKLVGNEAFQQSYILFKDALTLYFNKYNHIKNELKRRKQLN